MKQAMTTLQQYGVCPESYLPYTANPSEAPTPACDVAASPFKLSASPVSIDPDTIRSVLASTRAIVIEDGRAKLFEDVEVAIEVYNAIWEEHQLLAEAAVGRRH